jgi:hypothetical protein
MTKLIVPFRSFAHAPNKIIFKSRFNGKVSALSDKNVGSISKDLCLPSAGMDTYQAGSEKRYNVRQEFNGVQSIRMI